MAPSAHKTHGTPKYPFGNMNHSLLLGDNLSDYRNDCTETVANAEFTELRVPFFSCSKFILFSILCGNTRNISRFNVELKCVLCTHLLVNLFSHCLTRWQIKRAHFTIRITIAMTFIALARIFLFVFHFSFILLSLIRFQACAFFMLLIFVFRAFFPVSLLLRILAFRVSLCVIKTDLHVFNFYLVTQPSLHFLVFFSLYYYAVVYSSF